MSLVELKLCSPASIVGFQKLSHVKVNCSSRQLQQLLIFTFYKAFQAFSYLDCRSAGLCSLSLIMVGGLQRVTERASVFLSCLFFPVVQQYVSGPVLALRPFGS